MNQAKFDELRNHVNTNEAAAWEEALGLRKEFEERHKELLAGLQIASRDQAINRGRSVVAKVLDALKDVLDLSKIDSGHGIGHVGADFLHAMVLVRNLDLDPSQLYIGFVGGVLHDILGCTLVPRYEEGKRAVRHAEAGGLLLVAMAEEIGISREEAILFYYAIAAHTHYLKPTTVKCSDGVEREIQPYLDMLDGQPMMNVWLPRWVDRLDVNGPRFVGRHFLTLAEQHQDYSSSGGFYTVKFGDHMRPLLRGVEERGKDVMTMWEHINMFATSQNNESAYGRMDAGFMVTIRDAYKYQIFKIIDALEAKRPDHFFFDLSPEDKLKIIQNWTNWLKEKIEPSASGSDAAEKLKEMFLALPETTKTPWFTAMLVTMDEYKEWTKAMKNFVSDFSDEELTLPILGNMRNRI